MKLHSSTQGLDEMFKTPTNKKSIAYEILFIHPHFQIKSLGIVQASELELIKQQLLKKKGSYFFLNAKGLLCAFLKSVWHVFPYFGSMLLILALITAILQPQDFVEFLNQLQNITAQQVSDLALFVLSILFMSVVLMILVSPKTRFNFNYLNVEIKRRLIRERALQVPYDDIDHVHLVRLSKKDAYKNMRSKIRIVADD